MTQNDVKKRLLMVGFFLGLLAMAVGWMSWEATKNNYGKNSPSCQGGTVKDSR